MDLEITDKAFARVEELLKLENKAYTALRISVDGGGCSGFMYKYDFTDHIDESDYVAERLGIRIVIDSISQQYMSGCIVDFVEQLGSSYFEIRNPSAKSKCGCGNSFSI